MDKIENLKRLREGRAGLEAAIARLTPGQIVRPGACGQWSVKDLVAHITSWERHLLNDLGRMERGEALVEVGAGGSFDQVNEETYQRNKDRSWEEIQKDSQTAYSQLLQWLESVSEEELSAPYLYGLTLGDFIKVDTWEHYAEHRAQIERVGERV